MTVGFICHQLNTAEQAVHRQVVQTLTANYKLRDIARQVWDVNDAMWAVQQEVCYQTLRFGYICTPGDVLDIVACWPQSWNALSIRHQRHLSRHLCKY